MFDLNDAIANWRHNLEEGSKIGREDIDELESHLREELDQLAKMGPVTEEGSNKAVAQLGDVNKLNEEFSKIHREDSGLVEILEGEVLTMSSGKTFHSVRFTTALLFMGFCGIIGWLGTTWWLLDNTNFRGTDFWQVVSIIGNRSLWSSFFMIFAILGLVWGFRHIGQTKRKTQVIIRSLIPAVVLSPAYILVGMLVIVFTPLLGGWVKTAVAGPNIVQSFLSPDGRFEAYVVEEPSIDPPNQSLFVRRDKIHSKRIAKLPEDVDSIQKIYWSPHSDIVVFQTYFNLIAVRVPDYKMITIPLGGELHWRKNGTFWVDYDDVKQVTAIEFPQAGTFSYQLGDSDELKVIKIDSF